MQVSVLTTDSGVKEKLEKLSGGLLSYEEPLNDAGDDLIEFFGNENFNEQGAALDAPWKPLAMSTLQARARRTGNYRSTPVSSSKILVWTGKLKSGFKKKVSAFKLIVSNTVEYFESQNKNRRMIGVNSAVTKIIVDHMSTYIKKLLS